MATRINVTVNGNTYTVISQYATWGAYVFLCEGDITILKHGDKYPYRVRNKTRLVDFLGKYNLVEVIDSEIQSDSTEDYGYSVIKGHYYKLSSNFNLFNEGPNAMMDKKFLMFKLFEYIHILHMNGITHLNINVNSILIDTNLNVIITGPIFEYKDNYRLIAGLTANPVDHIYYDQELFTDCEYETDIYLIGLVLVSILTRNKHKLLSSHTIPHHMIKMIELNGTGAVTDEFLSKNKPHVAKYIKSVLPDIPNVDDTFDSQFGDIATPDELELLRMTLQLDPFKRASTLDCLQHPMFEDFFDPEIFSLTTEKFEYEKE